MSPAIEARRRVLTRGGLRDCGTGWARVKPRGEGGGYETPLWFKAEADWTRPDTLSDDPINNTKAESDQKMMFPLWKQTIHQANSIVRIHQKEKKSCCCLNCVVYKNNSHFQPIWNNSGRKAMQWWSSKCTHPLLKLIPKTVWRELELQSTKGLAKIALDWKPLWRVEPEPSTCWETEQVKRNDEGSDQSMYVYRRQSTGYDQSVELRLFYGWTDNWLISKYLSGRGDGSCLIVEADAEGGPFSSDEALEARLISTESPMLPRFAFESFMSTDPLNGWQKAGISRVFYHWQTQNNRTTKGRKYYETNYTEWDMHLQSNIQFIIFSRQEREWWADPERWNINRTVCL